MTVPEKAYKINRLTALCWALTVLLYIILIWSCGPSKKSQTSPTDPLLIAHEKSDTASADSSAELYVNFEMLRYDDHVYSDLVGDEQLFAPKFKAALPVISLETQDPLQMKFDLLTDSNIELRYKIIHCSAEWEADNTEPWECMDGFTENPIINFQHSFNTKVQYMHYEFSFPEASMKFKRSGNYLLLIYMADRPEEYLISRRFMVFESLFQIQENLKIPTIGKYRISHHEIDFNLKHDELELTDPFTNIKTVLLQNGNWNTAIRDLKPVFVKDNELVYDHNLGNLFEAGKEFRRFDTRILRINTEFVEKVDQDAKVSRVLLWPIKNRSYKRYIFERDLNGGYNIGSSLGMRPDVESDYCYVHFRLPGSAVSDGNVYLSGRFNQWRLEERNLMRYDDELQEYELTLMLKQGFYNYNILVTRPDGPPTQIPFEGTSTETENDYGILVYWSDLRNNYDRLVGFKQFNSRH